MMGMQKDEKFHLIKDICKKTDHFFELNVEKEIVVYLTRYKTSPIIIATESIGSDSQKLPSYGYFGEKKNI